MHTRTLLHCGLAAALCWTAGDILLVGFVQEPQRYPLFSHTLAAHLGSRTDMAVLMLSGSPQRLFWGVIPATFSIVFYLAAAFGVYRLMHSGRTAKFALPYWLRATHSRRSVMRVFTIWASARKPYSPPRLKHIRCCWSNSTVSTPCWMYIGQQRSACWLSAGCFFWCKPCADKPASPAPHGASTLCLQAPSLPYHAHCFPNQRLRLPSAVRLSIWHKYSFMPVPHTIKATSK